MTREEFKIIITALKSVYKNFGVEEKAQFEFWYVMLKDIPYEKMMIAVQKYVSTNKFAPTIADLRESSVVEKAMTGDAAWGQALRIVRIYGSYQESEALGSMDSAVRRLVSRLGYKELCMCEDVMSYRSQFMRLWDANVKQDREQAMLPDRIKNELTKMLTGGNPAITQED